MPLSLGEYVRDLIQQIGFEKRSFDSNLRFALVVAPAAGASVIGLLFKNVPIASLTSFVIAGIALALIFAFFCRAVRAHRNYNAYMHLKTEIVREHLVDLQLSLELRELASKVDFCRGDKGKEIVSKYSWQGLAWRTFFNTEYFAALTALLVLQVWAGRQTLQSPPPGISLYPLLAGVIACQVVVIWNAYRKISPSNGSREIKEQAMNTGTSQGQDRPAVDLALLVVRVIVGIIFAAHGAQKLFGAFGGPGLSKMVEMMGPLGYAVTIGEFFGGLGLVFGFLSRFSAASLIVIMIGAIATVHGKNGFFLGHSPESTLSTAGFEYNLALIGLLAPTLIAGPGRFAIAQFLPKSARTGRPIAVLE